MINDIIKFAFLYMSLVVAKEIYKMHLSLKGRRVLEQARQKELSQSDVYTFFHSLLTVKLSSLGFHEPTFSPKHNTTSFITHDHTIRIGLDGTVYGCTSDDEFQTVTGIVCIAKEATELWQESTLITDEFMYGYRILAKYHNSILAACFEGISGIRYAVGQFDGNGYRKIIDAGYDYVEAKDTFAAYLMDGVYDACGSSHDNGKAFDSMEEFSNKGQE